jgi:hypothetical protein
MEEWSKKVDLRKQFEGYTPLHTSMSCDEPHTTWRGTDFTVHVYGVDFPPPIGNTPAKLFPNKKD